MDNNNKTENEFSQFQVVLNGTVKEGFAKDDVVLAMAELFDQPEESIAPLMQANATIIKQSLPHDKAYQMQQRLLALGAETIIRPLIQQQASVQYSMVPEGEENTPFDELQAKLASGEKLVKCNHCAKVQIAAAECSDCSMPLMGKSIEADQLESNKAEGNRLSWWLSTALMVGAVAALFYWLLI